MIHALVQSRVHQDLYKSDGLCGFLNPQSSSTTAKKVHFLSPTSSLS